MRDRRAGLRAGVPGGRWALCRHPNYLGEVSFWWGLYLFALAADPAWWWAATGPLLITLLFLGISIPLMDRHLMKSRPGYARVWRERPALLPRFRRLGPRLRADTE